MCHAQKYKTKLQKRNLFPRFRGFFQYTITLRVYNSTGNTNFENIYRSAKLQDYQNVQYTFSRESVFLINTSMLLYNNRGVFRQTLPPKV